MDRASQILRPRHSIVAVSIAAFALSACSTTIPETDSEPPEVRLTITGPGLTRQEMSNPPTEEWTGPGGIQLFDLQPGVRYNFILSVSDGGGVQRAHMRVPVDFIISELEPARVDVTASGVTRNLTLFGDRSDARSGLVISGTLVAPPNIAFSFEVEGDDFGGRSGRSNQRFMSVNVFVGDD